MTIIIPTDGLFTNLMLGINGNNYLRITAQ